MAVMSRMGVRLGVPQHIRARGPLGCFGNFLPVAYSNVFAGVGWAAVTVVLGGTAFAELTRLPFRSRVLFLTLVAGSRAAPPYGAARAQTGSGCGSGVRTGRACGSHSLVVRR
jgi:hypothetical protein